MFCYVLHFVPHPTSYAFVFSLSSMVMGDYLCGWGRMSWYDGNGNAKGDDWGLGIEDWGGGDKGGRWAFGLLRRSVLDEWHGSRSFVGIGWWWWQNEVWLFVSKENYNEKFHLPSILLSCLLILSAEFWVVCTTAIHTIPHIYRRMDGWLDEWLVGWMDGWKDIFLCWCIRHVYRL